MCKTEPTLDFKALFEAAQTDCWKAARALKALGDLAQGDGSVPSVGTHRTLSFLATEDFSCLMDLLSERMDLKARNDLV